MTYGINTFEAGVADETNVDNTNITTGLTAGFTMVRTLAGTGTMKFDTASTHRGTLAVRCDGPATGDVARIDITMAGTQGCVEPYIRLSAYPTVDATNNPNGEQVLLSFRNSSGVAGSLNITSAGRCRLYDAGGQALWLSTSAIPLNQWVRYSLGAATGTATAVPYNGVLRFAYFAGADLETTSATETAGPTYSFSQTSTAANTGTANFSVIRVGKLQSGGAWSGVMIDDLQIENANANLIGGVTAGALPVLSYTLSDRVIVDASASSGSPTLALTYQSGPVVTITGPVSGVFTVIRPTGMTTPAVVRLSGTNGAGSATPVNITIPATGGTVTNIIRDAVYWTGSALA
jgi:hypothetical protein